VVAKAGDWLQCSLGATRWEGIPEPFGYVMPLSWANEMLDLPESYTDGYKEQVQSTQVAAASAKLWCLILSGLAALCATVVFCARRLSKRDYEHDERLLDRDLVLDKESAFFAGDEYGMLYGGGGGDEKGGRGDGSGGGGGGYQPPGGGAEEQEGSNRGAGPFISNAWV
jgi:uncharacterized membrane protein YgcG